MALLEQRFREGRDDSDRMAAASMLLLIGKGGDEHLALLVDAVEKALEADLPFPFTEQGEVRDEFRQWALEGGLDLNDALLSATTSQLAGVIFLARAHRPEAASVLRRALNARNYFLSATAAGGLTRLGCDEDVVVDILTVAAKAPAGLALAYSQALLLCETPLAGAEAKRLVQERVYAPGSVAEQIMKERSEGFDEFFASMLESRRRELGAERELLSLREDGE